MGYVLRWGRIVPALLAGAVLGATVVATAVATPYWLARSTGAFYYGLIAFILAFMAWAVGLMVVGGPIWVFNEMTGARSPLRAVWSGMAATSAPVCAFALLWLLGASGLGREALSTALAYSLPFWLLMSLLGGAVGALIWRIAYRREQGE